MTIKSTSNTLTKIYRSKANFPGSVLLRHTSTLFLRGYATQTLYDRQPRSSRKQVTVVNDDGRVQWKDLSIGEKAARTTQQTLNFGVVLTGFIMTGGVIYLLYSDVFSTDSKTRHFNRAVDQIRADPRAKEILGSEFKIRAFGEPTNNKWARARPLSSSLRKDKTGTEHFQMHFNVEGSSRSGVVRLHLIKRPGEAEFEYKYMFLDVEGHPRIFLENADEVKGIKKPGVKMFGVQWR